MKPKMGKMIKTSPLVTGLGLTPKKMTTISQASVVAIDSDTDADDEAIPNSG